MSQPPYARDLGLMLCHTCGQTCSQDVHYCPRCEAVVHARKPNSLSRTWAFLVASLIFYIPANVLPVMYTQIFGSGSENTILSGVLEFWQHGSWDIALLIFIASVVVPCIKFFVLGMLLITCQRRSHWAMRERAKLYRFIEVIGYWSMLDVLVVALVAALVQFHALSSIEPRMGILFFGLVVVLTMFAAMSFDPRLIWDVEVEDV
ncbi:MULTISPECIES: paraquat-inducible protein A [Pseudomonas]|uniref:Paraquat-inducible protein A n=1 Tax=Pseudomonas chlororaphis subsp. aureofaciens TaxID=587851 RepID=A0AAD0ZGA8_9PSED|nr:MULTISPECIES: paraquat-inducible protein A [Pseudomonas]AIC21698.1 paraquat-inducible protein A [Pseudomonas chlororaphis]AZD94318.1 Paraquat-inducible protein A [Pseudomonas chlororaphis subsp. aureofaciens]AZE25236.1 Paraquat-inducible protein A [Pseudomonas chlororaphis subsp. aureofaciens]AZE31436.1 Paraquat-inducible protein A [Pseudomonas chlororaphis subsp. aureofaciens]AZE44150.1 Paraquat-inducible protein A [Pseudomonas chlororaphis subsp. aureofaciens]